MRITLVNLTQSPILYHTNSLYDSDVEAKPIFQIALLPSSSTTTKLPKRCTKLTLIPRDGLIKHESDTAIVETESPIQAKDSPRNFDVDVKTIQRNHRSTLIEGSPWRMYQSKVSFWLLILALAHIFGPDITQTLQDGDPTSSRFILVFVGSSGYCPGFLTSSAR